MKHDLSRAHFLGAGAALSAFTALPKSARATEAPAADTTFGRVDRALVLSGGGARGSYEAGIIDYLASSQGLRDGVPLAPYGIICGTSIGALNGYFVATGQFSKLRNLWYTVADEAPVRLKARYAALTDNNSGLGTRVAQALRLAFGMTANANGVLDGKHLRAWMARHIDPTRPVVTPFVWTVTNLTRQSPEYFYLVPKQLSPAEQAIAVSALQATVGPKAILREATHALLIDALRASAAIPVAFSPVELPDASGARAAYVDGGVTANTPIGVARAAARSVDVVMLDPLFESATYKNALDIGLAVFGAMQKRILEADIHAAYVESLVKQAMVGTGLSPEARSLAKSLFDSDFFILRPKSELPVGAFAFDDRKALFQTYKRGFERASSGFPRYHYGMFGQRPKPD